MGSRVKYTIIALAALGVLAVAGIILIPRLNPTRANKYEMDFETMVKIQVYNAADLELGVYLEDGAYASAASWAYRQVQEAARQQNADVNATYATPITTGIIDGFRTLADLGYISTDGMGSISELSKSYIANMVASAVFSEAPELRDVEVIAIEYQNYQAGLVNTTEINNIKTQIEEIETYLKSKGVEGGSGYFYSGEAPSNLMNLSPSLLQALRDAGYGEGADLSGLVIYKDENGEYHLGLADGGTTDIGPISSNTRDMLMRASFEAGKSLEDVIIYVGEDGKWHYGLPQLDGTTLDLGLIPDNELKMLQEWGYSNGSPLTGLTWYIGPDGQPHFGIMGAGYDDLGGLTAEMQELLAALGYDSGTPLGGLTLYLDEFGQYHLGIKTNESVDKLTTLSPEIYALLEKYGITEGKDLGSVVIYQTTTGEYRFGIPNGDGSYTDIGPASADDVRAVASAGYSVGEPLAGVILYKDANGQYYIGKPNAGGYKDCGVITQEIAAMLASYGINVGDNLSGIYLYKDDYGRFHFGAQGSGNSYTDLGTLSADEVSALLAAGYREGSPLDGLSILKDDNGQYIIGKKKKTSDDTLDANEANLALSQELQALKTLISVMEYNFNSKIETSSANGGSGMTPEEQAEINVQLLAQYDSITAIQGNIAELYQEIGNAYVSQSQEASQTAASLEEAYAAVSEVKGLLETQLTENNALQQVIDSDVKDLVDYKAAMQTETNDIRNSVTVLEASMTGTITSNYAELQTALDNKYSELSSKLASNVESLDAQMKANDEKTTSALNEAKDSLTKALNDKSEQLDAQIKSNDEKINASLSEAEQKLTTALEEAKAKLQETMDTNQNNANEELSKYKDEVADTFDIVNARITALEQKFGTSTATTTQLISTLITQSGTLDTSGILTAVNTNVAELTQKLNTMRTELNTLYTTVSNTTTNAAASTTMKDDLLNGISDLLIEINDTQIAVDQYATSMRDRIAAIDDAIIKSTTDISATIADVQQRLIDAANALIALQNAEKVHSKALKKRVADVTANTETVCNTVEDLKLHVNLEDEVTSLTTSLNNNVQTLNDTITQLESDTQTELTNLETRLTDALNDAVTDLTNANTAEENRLDVLENETKVLFIPAFTIAYTEWIANSGTYYYKFTSPELSPILGGNYNVQVSISYAAGVPINPTYTHFKEGDTWYVAIVIDDIPAGNANVNVDRVTIYYRPEAPAPTP